VKALADEATRAPATFVEMQACVTALMTGAARVGSGEVAGIRRP
jgi:hypothetical protein